MSIITLLTDFGTKDEYVGLMKGVILSIDPDATIIDITHQIDPQDLVQAAYTITSSYTYFPKGTVHVVVVDPGVGSDRAILALALEGHIFLAPNNGVLTLLLREGRVESLVHVDNSDFFLETVSQTFHGRDIFAPIAGRLSKGLDIHALGDQFNHKNLVSLPLRQPYLSEKGEWIGAIVWIDRFGNLITNIDQNSLDKFCRANPQKKILFQIGDHKITGLSRNYASVKAQSPLAVIGSRGYLEIAINCGDAGKYFSAQKGDLVRVSLTG
jgi:S-adenosylmethionine hydrolase